MNLQAKSKIKMVVTSVLLVIMVLLKIIIGGAECIQEDGLEEAEQLMIWPNMGHQILKEFTILIDFIKIIEQTEEKKNVNVKGWLIQVEKSNRLMTP